MEWLFSCPALENFLWSWSCRPLFIILSAVPLLTYYAWTHFTRVARLLNKFPGTVILPFIGNSLPFANSDQMPKNLSKLFLEFGKTFRVWMLHQPFIVTSDVALIQKVLSSQKHVEKGDSYREGYFLMGHGLVTAPTAKWRKDRKELKPAFRTHLLSNFISCFNKNAKILTSILEKKFENGTGMLNIRPEVGRCTIDIISETAMDECLDAQLNPETRYYEVAVEAIELIRLKIFQPWVKLPIIWNVLGYAKAERECSKLMRSLYFAPEHLKKRQKEYLKLVESGEFDENSKRFIHLLLESDRDFEDMLFHGVSIFGAGFDTTSTVMNFTLYCLAVNPEVQVKVQEELDLILGSECSDLDRDISMEDVKDLKYLELVIKESMRFYPPATFLIRKLLVDESLGNGLILPKESSILILPWDVHHDPENYPEPEEFIPERFLPENSKDRSAYAFLPFSAGPRNCMGQSYAIVEMKVLLGHILRRFHVTTNQKPEELILHYGVVLEAKGGLQLSLTPRFPN